MPSKANCLNWKFDGARQWDVKLLIAVRSRGLNFELHTADLSHSRARTSGQARPGQDPGKVGREAGGQGQAREDSTNHGPDSTNHGPHDTTLGGLGLLSLYNIFRPWEFPCMGISCHSHLAPAR